MFSMKKQASTSQEIAASAGLNRVFGEFFNAACVRFAVCFQTNSTAMMLFVGVVLLFGGLAELAVAQGGGPTGSFSEAAFDDELIRNSVANLFKLIEGAFGALVMVIAGIMAIIAAAMGAYRAAVSLVVVAIGAFILRALVSLFFGTDFSEFEAT